MCIINNPSQRTQRKLPPPPRPLLRDLPSATSNQRPARAWALTCDTIIMLPRTPASFSPMEGVQATATGSILKEPAKISAEPLQKVLHYYVTCYI